MKKLLALGLIVMLGNTIVSADSTFVIADPEVDFEIIDMNPFDGFGDTGPFSTYNTVGYGTLGEVREMAEFNLADFEIPAGEVITSATFECRITSIVVGGLGVPFGDIPNIMGCDAYLANGIEEHSDFEAGDDYHIGSIDTSNAFVGQILAYDVTDFVADSLAHGEIWLGFTMKGEEFGLMAIQEGSGYPKLTIETGPAGGLLGDMNCDGVVNNFDIDPFVLALTNPAQYEATYPNCQLENGDINGDGAVNNFDIDPFVALLTGL